jgi:hypothetical protein
VSLLCRRVEVIAAGALMLGWPARLCVVAETIKDCLGAGMPVPRYFIVPLERFNRQLGSNVGINVAEFEFPAYYNFFFHRQSVNLIVDSKEVQKLHWRVRY